VVVGATSPRDARAMMMAAVPDLRMTYSLVSPPLGEACGSTNRSWR